MFSPRLVPDAYPDTCTFELVSLYLSFLGRGFLAYDVLCSMTLEKRLPVILFFYSSGAPVEVMFRILDSGIIDFIKGFDGRSTLLSR